MLTLALLLAQPQGDYPTQRELNDGGGAGVFSLVFVVIVFLVFFALPIWGIVDAIRRPPEAWKAAGQSKSLWIVVQFFVWILGSLIYVFAVRPGLKRVDLTQVTDQRT